MVEGGERRVAKGVLDVRRGFGLEWSLVLDGVDP